MDRVADGDYRQQMEVIFSADGYYQEKFGRRNHFVQHVIFIG